MCQEVPDILACDWFWIRDQKDVGKRNEQHDNDGRQA
jgi:hypothetical protein